MNLIYQDNFLYLTPYRKLLVRIIFSAFWVLGILLTIDLLVSGSDRLISAGVILGLFIASRLWHRSSPDVVIDKYFLTKSLKLETLNTFSACPAATINVIRQAFTQAQIRKSPFIDTFLLEELLRQSIVKKALARLGIDLDKFSQEVEATKIQLLTKSEARDSITGSQNYPSVKDPFLISLLERLNFIVSEGFNLAASSAYSRVNPELLLAGVLESQVFELRKLFADFNLTKDIMMTAINLEYFSKKLPKRLTPQPFAIFAAKKQSKRILNRAWTSRPTPFLDSISKDLTELARSGSIGFILGHESSYERLINILARATKNNALLLGDPGTGKKTLVWHLAKRIINDEVPEKLFDKRLIELDVSILSSGTSSEELQGRLNKITDEIMKSKNIILFIDDFHNLKLAGASGGLSAYDILKPYFKAAEFQTIGSTDEKDYQKYLLNDSDFQETFEILPVEEISEEEAVTLLSMEALVMEKQFNILIEVAAIQRAVNLAKRYLRPKLLPSSARDLLEEAVEEARKVRAKKITQQDIVDLASRITKIPLGEATQSEAAQLLDLESKIHQRLIDQEEGVKEVAQALRQFRAGLSRKKGTIASFLFVGPTGVGKTELSKILANVYFGGEEQMIRFDMSEFQLKESIDRFIGSGQDTSASLAQAVKDRPYSLVLLDEFEKAHPDILNLFLSVFDDGRLTDSLGNVVDFTNTIIISTSNARSDLIKQELEKGAGFEEISDKVKKALGDYFKPELLNRFDAIVVFKPLAPEDILAIAKLNLKDIANDLENEQGILINFNDSAIQEIAKEGYDPVFGARPLRRVISDRIKDKLAILILKREVQRGNQVAVSFENNDFLIKK